MTKLHGHQLSDVPLRVISIDPGSGKAGYSVIDYSSDGYVDVIYSNTLAGNALSALYFDNWLRDFHGERLVRNMAHGLFLNKLLCLYKPDFVACEAAYAGKFIAAYKSLTEHTTLLRAACYNYSPYLEFAMIEPSKVKAAMGVSGKSGDKTLMTKALAKRKDINYASEIDFASLDEHSIDSICIGIAANEIVRAAKLKKVKSKRQRK